MTTTEFLALALITIAVTLALFPMFLAMTRRRPSPSLDPDIDDDTRRPIMGELTNPLAQQIPVTSTGREELQRLLMAAGFYHRSALSEYLAIRTVATLVPIFIAVAIALVVPNAMMMRVLIG